jgi:integrase
LESESIPFAEVDEDLCIGFRKYLLDKYKGGTPVIYFERFKEVLKSAAKKGFIEKYPASDVESKGHRPKKKDILEIENWIQLLNTPFPETDTKKAAITTLYTGLRWIDIKQLVWEEVREDHTIVLDQQKTEGEVAIPLHPDILYIFQDRQEDNGLVFKIGNNRTCNNFLRAWVKEAKITKKITWHCLRHTISVILQDEGASPALTGQILGHSDGGKLASTTYNRYRPKPARAAINKLPAF